MQFVRFLFSKTFLYQLLIAILVLVLLIFLALQWLDYTTNHHEHISVPDLSGLSLSEAQEQLSEQQLNFEIIDSSLYNPEFPKQSVIEQIPAAGKAVKEDRRIYLRINASSYRQVELPNLINKTRRQVEPTLLALGFAIGDITYKPNIAKDLVLELRYKNRVLKPGDKITKTSVIDLVLGDGKLGDVDEDSSEAETTEPHQE
ncbi:MAG: PASTA domain-containing protein [Flavobacteriaceae bacterium]|nr:PASTA domain-containing protein [Flavobacteriaceae bacterium]